ncbi:hypothetical protein [Achromobacter sp. AGC39]
MAKAFNKEQLQIMIEMLQEAQRDIRAKRNGSICPRLWNMAASGHAAKGELGRYLTDWISQMLLGHAFLEDWLARKGYISYGVATESHWENRVAWIDWMVGELESEVRALDAAAAAKQTPDERFRIAA